MTTEMIISDMTICEPSSAMSRNQTDDKWYMVDYETDDGMEGTMIYADTRCEVPQIKNACRFRWVVQNICRNQLHPGARRWS